MSNEKRKGIYIMVLSAFLVVVSIVAILFFIESKSVKETLIAKEQEYKSNLGNLNNDSATKVENTITEKEVEKKVEVPKTIGFDRTKGKKVKDGVVYGSIITDMALNRAKVEILPNGSLKQTTYDENYKVISEGEVSGLSGKAIDIVTSYIGDGSDEYTIIMMEDGTVEYIGDTLDYNNRDFSKSKGKIPGLNNIVRILCCSTSGVPNTGRAVIAIDKDGYFYDVKQLILGR